MLRISKKTHLNPSEIVKRATRYFGPQGLGLDESDHNPCCAYFEGGGGYVRLTLSEEDSGRVVDLETREWEYPVKKFLGSL